MQIKKTILITLVFILLNSYKVLASVNVVSVDDPNIKQIIKYDLLTSYNVKKNFKTVYPGFGSSLIFKGKDKTGNLIFYALTDRGPNLGGPELTSGENSIIFSDPSFIPAIGVVKMKENEFAIIDRIIPIHSSSGLPLPTDSKNRSRKEVPLTLDLKLLGTDINGLDPECIDFDAEGNIWIGEEYGPSLMKIKANDGKVIKRLFPGAGLPEIFKYRLENRGFESISVTPNGKIYAALEGVVDINHQTKDIAQFIRIVEYDPNTSQTKMFAYPYDLDTYQAIKDVKLGDMVAIDNSNFLLIEQGVTKNGEMRNSIQIINIENATDLTGLKLASNQELEYARTRAELGNINFIKKKKLLEVRDYDWRHNKLEGVAIINDNEIAISNDNDFGIIESVSGHTDEDIKNYKVDTSKQALIHNGKLVNAKVYAKKIPNKNTQIWVIELITPISKLISKWD